MIKKTTCSPEETIEFGIEIGKKLRGGDIVAYRGRMGAGKTTFTRGMAIGMGLDDEVTSPTFSLVNEYNGKKLTLYHFDMYRIENGNDLETTGFYDYMGSDSVIAVEWSENIADILPKGTIYIDIINSDDNIREITVSGDSRFDIFGTTLFDRG